MSEYTEARIKALGHALGVMAYRAEGSLLLLEKVLTQAGINLDPDNLEELQREAGVEAREFLKEELGIEINPIEPEESPEAPEA